MTENPMDKLTRLACVIVEAKLEIEHLRRRIETAKLEADKHARENIEALVGLRVGATLRRERSKLGGFHKSDKVIVERCMITGAVVTFGYSDPTKPEVWPTGKLLNKDGQPGKRDADKWALRRWREDWSVDK